MCDDINNIIITLKRNFDNFGDLMAFSDIFLLY